MLRARHRHCVTAVPARPVTHVVDADQRIGTLPAGHAGPGPTILATRTLDEAFEQHQTTTKPARH